LKLELPAEKKLVHTLDIPIRWGDMDAMGHVNNTVYFRYMEVARIEWMSAIGCPPTPTGFGPLVMNAFCNFHQQLEYPGEVRVRTYVSDPGRSSFESWCLLSRADDPDTIYASGGATTVWVDYQAKRSAPMPEWLRAIVS
jgi:acyl-CoA thioester hydrolase